MSPRGVRVSGVCATAVAALALALALLVSSAAASGEGRTKVTLNASINGLVNTTLPIVILPNQDFRLFLYVGGINLFIHAKRAFLADGVELLADDDLELLRDNDHVVFSEGEDYISEAMVTTDHLNPLPDEDFRVEVVMRDRAIGPVVTIKGLKKKPIGIPISITTLTGWGNFAFHIAYELLKSDEYTPILLEEYRGDVFLYPMDRPYRWQLRERAQQWASIKKVIDEENLEPNVKFDFPLILALASELRGITEYRGTANIGFVFFEDSHFSPEALRVAGTYDMVIGGSTWNSDVLRHDWNQTHAFPVLQGVDTNNFRPRPKQNKYPGRFVVFSGGKLEYRKGQDLVIAAFKRFHERHPDAMLLVAWQNFWHRTIDGIEQTGYCVGKPGWHDDGVLRIEEWLIQQNGFAPGSIKSLGPIPNSRFAEELAEVDVALFPNRCEGGTNLVAMETLAAGVPVIMSANTGHMDLVSDERMFPLYVQHAVAKGHWKGQKGWGEADVNEMVDRLEEVYSNRGEAQRRARNAVEFMQTITWDKQIPELLRVMEPAIRHAYSESYGPAV